MSKILTSKYIVLSAIILGFIFISTISTRAATSTIVSDPNVLVCDVLGSLGMACSPTSTYVKHNYNSNYATVSDNSGSVLGASNSKSATQATIYVAGKRYDGNSIILVQVKGQKEIYEIIDGKKHLIPNMDIFYDYGFKLEMIQNIFAIDLVKYPRVKLIKIPKSSKTYYLTEGSMTRHIADKQIFDSYGDRNEDIIEISQKEFNFYPKNEFIFLENPLNRDVFQIVNSTTKRYLTPMAVRRMNIKNWQVAPVNQTELSYYKAGQPIIF